MSNAYKTYQTLYCDFGFIQKVYTTSNDKFKQLYLFLTNLNKRINFVFNIPKSKLDVPIKDSYNDYTITSLISILKHTYSRDNFIDDEKISLKKFIKEHNYNVIVFCNKNNDNINILRSYGIIAINSSMLMLTPDILDDLMTENGRYLEKTKTLSWEEILPQNANQCNSVIIIDQYILQNEDKLKHNINDILETIIPKKLEIEFHIAIFCNFEANNKNYNIEKRFNDILKHLNDKNVPNSKNISITIYDSKNKFHDRYIITNNHFIESGAGFVIFNNSKKLGNSTIIRSCYPFLISSEFQNIAYRHILTELTQIKQNCTNFDIEEKKQYEFFGNKSGKAPHRLIDRK